MDYVEAFENLKANEKYGRKTPHKAILLLTIIEMYETNEISANEIRYNQALVNTFRKVWSRTLPNDTSYYVDAFLPFWTMQNEGFWHFVPVRGKEEILSFFKENNRRPTEGKIKECIDYVELDEDLYFLMSLPSGRSSLKHALLSHYSPLSEEEIDALSESKANDTDNSLAALEEYKNMLNSKNEPNVSFIQQCSNDKLSGRFYELNEDVQIQLNIEYYTFLKEHRVERSLIKELFPTVFELYDKISEHPLKKGNVASSLISLYENFLLDLKINLLGVDDTMEVIDSIDNALAQLNLQVNDDNVVTEEDEISIVAEDENLQLTEKEESEPSELEQRRKDIPWTENEEELLLLCFDKGRSLEDIAKVLGRPKSSIQMRLANLGKIEYDFVKSLSTEDATSKELDLASSLDYYVENMESVCCILNKYGERVYYTDGKFKIFHEKLYRFNYKDGICLTVKDMVRTDGVWEKGGKILVAYSNSDLFHLLDRNHYIDQIEDLEEGASMHLNKIRVAGNWYDFAGNLIGVSTEPLLDIMNAEDNDTDQLVYQENGFVPKGRLATIPNLLAGFYDYLWLMAIVDIMGDSTHSLKVDFDELACMMIAEGWNILGCNPQLKVDYATLTECIEYLIDESKINMKQELSWETSSNVIFAEIKDYPMSGIFEDIVDELVKTAPLNVLHIWLDDKDEYEMVLHSANYVNQCLYSLHFKKFESYIEVNPAWRNYLLKEHDKLLSYIKDKCLLVL